MRQRKGRAAAPRHGQDDPGREDSFDLEWAERGAPIAIERELGLQPSRSRLRELGRHLVEVCEHGPNGDQEEEKIDEARDPKGHGPTLDAVTF
jgi:hypothetical protein